MPIKCFLSFFDFPEFLQLLYRIREKSRVKLLLLSGWMPKFFGAQTCEGVQQRFLNHTNNFGRISCRTFQVKEWYFLSIIIRMAVLKCAETNRETINRVKYRVSINRVFPTGGEGGYGGLLIILFGIALH